VSEKTNVASSKNGGAQEKKPNFFLPCGRKIYLENGPPLPKLAESAYEQPKAA
jgi:hypothetical protein